MAVEEGESKGHNDDGTAVDAAEAFRAATHRCLGSKSEPFEVLRARAKALDHAFRAEMAKTLLPSFNALLAAAPQDTLAEKQRLATTVNAALREVGLSVKCPRTGNPAILIADLKGGDHPGVSRFRFESRDERGRKVRNCTLSTVSEVELMAHPLRREALERGRGGISIDG